jgi:hypothetical protein
MFQKGQLALEYLLVFLASLAALALVFPLLEEVYEASFFALDCSSASCFASSLQGLVSEMSFQADGAKAEIKARPFGKWLVFSRGNELFIKVLHGREKSFSVSFPNKVGFSQTPVESERVFFLKKERNQLVLE